VEPPTSLQQAKDLQEDLVTLRQILHCKPELAFNEFETAAILAEKLTSYGYSIHTGIAQTGLIAQIGEGPAVAIHAAMDAISKDNSKESAFHGCGHDANMACVLGAARLVARRLRKRTAGSVRLIFQPATEISGPANTEAAKQLIDQGVLNGCIAILGLHVDSTIKSGNIALVRPAHSSAEHEHVQKTLLDAATDLIGSNRIAITTRATYGCDFSRYSEKTPSALFYLGVGLAGRFCSHHSSDFAIDDAVLYVGAGILTDTVFRLLRASAKVI
jgi:metal-dependent amidase/aminoacylase/carboxypeptidase family protein